MGELQTFSPDKLALIKRTVAKECTDDEFRLFVHICQAVRLDPLRRQAHAFVFGKGGDKDKRQLTVVTSIGGYRSIAERTGNYRPDDNAPRYTKCEPTATNPLGIESCEITVYKFSHGQWWPVAGQAFWDEYVPLAASDDDVEWVETGETWPDSGKPKKKKVVKPGAVLGIDPSKQGWVKMPRIMIAKCAEAAALRRAWPDDFANIHAEEETHRAEAMDVIEAAENAERKERVERIGGPGLIIDWMDGNDLQRVQTGKFYDAAISYLRTCNGQPGTIRAWRERNRHALNDFWTLDKAACLDLRKKLDAAEAEPMLEAVDEPKLVGPDGKALRIEAARQVVRQIEGTTA